MKATRRVWRVAVSVACLLLCAAVFLKTGIDIRREQDTIAQLREVGGQVEFREVPCRGQGWWDPWFPPSLWRRHTRLVGVALPERNHNVPGYPEKVVFLLRRLPHVDWVTIWGNLKGDAGGGTNSLTVEKVRESLPGIDVDVEI